MAAVLLVLAALPCSARAAISGELRQWHRITLTFEGPGTDEGAETNPFTDYRLDVTFANNGRSFVVPGYFAADGNAANTGASGGNKWRVHFSPDRVGTWSWQANFRQGSNVAIAPERNAGASGGHFDGARGTFEVGASDKIGRDHRGKGRLQYVGEHYLRFAGNGEWFIKAGPDSPEGFLANPDIDGSTKGTRSTFAEHGRHWRPGDPTWADGKGKNVVGAVNYIAGQEMNVFYLLLYTGHGDTRSVWPYRDVDDHLRFDVSKLDQWEIIFDHMDRRGILLHLVLTETENESYWEERDGGVFAPSRKLYFREMIARFGHHLALVWNLGEEIGWTDKKGGAFGVATTDEQRKAFCDFIRSLDPYRSPIVAHTLPNKGWTDVYAPLLGYPAFEGVSGQFPLAQNGMKSAHETIKEWIDLSVKAGRKWVVSNDEPGGDDLPLKLNSKGERADTAGVRPDVLDPTHDFPRKWFLWGSLMAGAGGVETYFGWDFTQHGGGDGAVTNYAAWSNWWAQKRHAHRFFMQHLPFWKMRHADELVGSGNFCFALQGEIFAIYLPEGGTAELDLSGAEGEWEVRWYDPRVGGGLQEGSIAAVQGGARRSLGAAPYDADKDWALLVRRPTRTGPPQRRAEISLNGDWPEGGRVPVYAGSEVVEKIYARDVSVPASWAGKTAKLEFDGVNFTADVSVDGKHVGRHVGGWLPFTMDITRHVAPGRSFRLEVAVKGRRQPPYVDANGRPLWPVGDVWSQTGDDLFGGIVDDVWLRAYGVVHVEDAWIRTSVRKKELLVGYTIRNAGRTARTVYVAGTVRRASTADVEKEFRANSITIPAGADRTLSVKVPWDAPALWWPDRPELYHLTSRVLEDDREVDSDTRRFGFREVWTEGERIMLNGVRFNLRSDFVEYGQDWPASTFERRNWPDVVDRLKTLNINSFRMHKYPAPRFVYEIADEKGLPIIAESAINGDTKKYMDGFDRTLYAENAATWLKRWVKAARNHPSIVMWSSSNEMFHVKYSPEETRALASAIRSEDPTRPILHAGMGDVGDELDSHHYPRKAPWSWNGEPWNLESGIYHGWKQFLRSGKPVLATECLNVPGRSKPIYSEERNKWWHGIWTRGMRYAGWAQISPGEAYNWILQESNPEDIKILNYRNGFHPVALFDKEYDALGIDPLVTGLEPGGRLPEAAEGAWLDRTLVLYNDEFRGTAVTVQVAVKSGSITHANGAREYHVPLGSRLEIPYRFQVPIGSGQTVEIVLCTSKEGRRQFEEVRQFSVVRKNGAFGATSSIVELGSGQIQAYNCR